MQARDKLKEREHRESEMSESRMERPARLSWCPVEISNVFTLCLL